MSVSSLLPATSRAMALLPQNGAVAPVTIGATAPVAEPRTAVRVQMYRDPMPPEAVVKLLGTEEEPMDVYCWYEGTQGLPVSGATFMRDAIFAPLFARKNNVKLNLYSLRGWDFRRMVDRMAPSSLLGDVVNRINRSCTECISSSSFFQYCSQVVPGSPLYTYIQEVLPRKAWLQELSASQRLSGTTVGQIFNNRRSLLDCLYGQDTSRSYSQMQYVEGYYLVRQAVTRGLAEGKTKIKIAFVLPNDETKYYRDMPENLGEMLRLDFGAALRDVEVDVSFIGFQFGDSPSARPYIDKRRRAPQVAPDEVGTYLSFLPLPVPPMRMPLPPALPTPYLPRDIIHNLND